MERNVTESAATIPAAELLRLADRIEREHADGRFCPCCSTDAIHLRDLVRHYEGASHAE